MDDLVILGGGPGGLYSAILLKSAWPSSRVRVFERNRPDDTYGFGVAFHNTTLRNLAEADAPSLEGIEKILIPWDDVHFRVRGVDHRVSGHGFAGCSRRLLLQVLQRRAAELGVEHHFRSEARAANSRTPISSSPPTERTARPVASMPPISNRTWIYVPPALCGSAPPSLSTP